MCLFLFLDSTGKTYHAWGDRAAVKEKAKGKKQLFFDQRQPLQVQPIYRE